VIANKTAGIGLKQIARRCLVVKTPVSFLGEVLWAILLAFSARKLLSVVTHGKNGTEPDFSAL